MNALAATFSLLIAIAGWYYLFYATPTAGLISLERPTRSQLRARLRRLGGLTMLALAVVLYIAVRYLPPDRQTRAPLFVAWAWIGVIVLLAIVLALGIVDVLLTSSLRRDLRRKRP